MTLISENEPEVLVVMYHYVHDEPPTVGSDSLGPHAGVRGSSTRAFSEQLDRLCAVAEPIDWPTLHAWTQGLTELPPRSFLVTFDEGLADHARHAAPELEKRGLRGTFFVPGQVLTTPRMLSAHAIHALLSRLGDDRFARQLQLAIGTDPRSAEWTSMLENSSTTTSRNKNPYYYESPKRAGLKTWLTLQLPIPIRGRVIDELFERFIGAHSDGTRQWYLSLNDLTELQSRGHTIGGHGFAHEPLARWNAPDQEEDITRCARTLTEGLGRAVRPFSYPFGSWNESAIAACRRVGFAHAFTTDSRPMHKSDCVMRLPRIDTIHLSAHLQSEIPSPLAT